MGEMEIKGSGSYFSDFGGRRCLAHPQALEGRVLDASAAHSSLVMFFSPLWATRARVGALGVRWCALVYVLSASCFLGLRSFCSLATSRTHLTHSCINSLTRSTVGASLTRSQSVSAAPMVRPSRPRRPASHAGRVCMYVHNPLVCRCVCAHQMCTLSFFLSFFLSFISRQTDGAPHCRIASGSASCPSFIHTVRAWRRRAVVRFRRSSLERTN